MDCSVVREAISACLDGEEGPIDEAAADTHVASCRACQAWREDLATLHRTVRVRAADPVPDLSGPIVDAHLPTAHRRGRSILARGPLAEPVSPVRWGLFVVALTQLVLAVPPLLFGEDAGATVHVARELGSFDVALAVGLLVAAWQPARSWGLFPVVAALGLVMIGTAVLDVLDDAARIGGETHHLLDLAGVVLLWMVARDVRPGDRVPKVSARAA
jgi:predicted anti-sigma-YlaC factor YlaD